MYLKLGPSQKCTCLQTNVFLVSQAFTSGLFWPLHFHLLGGVSVLLFRVNPETIGYYTNMPCQCGYPDGMSPLGRMVFPRADICFIIPNKPQFGKISMKTTMTGGRSSENGGRFAGGHVEWPTFVSQSQLTIFTCGKIRFIVTPLSHWQLSHIPKAMGLSQKRTYLQTNVFFVFYAFTSG